MIIINKHHLWPSPNIPPKQPSKTAPAELTGWICSWRGAVTALISSAGEKNLTETSGSKNLQAALPAELGEMPMLLSREEIASPRGADAEPRLMAAWGLAGSQGTLSMQPAWGPSVPAQMERDQASMWGATTDRLCRQCLPTQNSRWAVLGWVQNCIQEPEHGKCWQGGQEY